MYYFYMHQQRMQGTETKERGKEMTTTYEAIQKIEELKALFEVLEAERYDNLSDYGKGLKDILNMFYGGEDTTSEELIECFKHSMRKGGEG